ncbi:MAG: efflux RND transporter permease subunit [Bacteroidales bacterium]|jgi:RND transporter, HAE1 family|uniref:efflux RND transporter permease subunit n=2 Tax=Candidatus Limisoma sp. TaxID=3076476 RepID=UPI000A5DC56C|nr:efflux RND transporter permease subunit [Bacteroidales bacterium]
MKLDTFINRPVLSTVISIFIVILGVVGMLWLPITQYPDIAPPTIQVSTTYTGADAKTVLNSVIAPIEEQINGAEGMTYIQSTATNTGSATITVYFEQGFDPDMAAVDVQNRVAKAQSMLPAEVTRVGVITQKRQTSMLLVFSLLSPDGKFEQEFIENYMKINVIPQIQRVNGVGDAMVMGADYSMRIWLKPDAMAQHNLMPSDVSAALADQNIEAAPGQFGENGGTAFQYVMRYRGRLITPEEFDKIIIRADKDGNVLYLKDVATMELGRVSYGFKGKTNGHPAASAIIFQTAGSNATQVIKDVEAKINEAGKELPNGLEFNVSMNTNDFLYASIEEVIKTLIEAFILVFLVVYVFLQDLRSTIIPAIAIPVALIGTFFGLYLIGFSINLLTLSALVLAIAIVVDDAIVVVEAVHAKLDEGYTSARMAAIDAMREIGGAIVSITLVMMLVFIPVSFMSGTSGVFYRQFGLTMAIAIGLSALNALTLSPALCAVFLKPHKADGGSKKVSFVKAFHEGFNRNYEKLLVRYKKWAGFFINHKITAFGVVAASIVALAAMMMTTSTALVPNEDTGVLFCMVNMPPATSLDKTEATLAKVDKILAANPAVESRTEILGYSFIAGQGNTYGTFIVKLKDWSEREKGQDATSVLGQLYGAVGQQIKDATVMMFQPPMISGYSVTSGFELQLQDKTGGDINKFFQIYQQFIGALNQRPEIQQAYSTFNPTFPQYMVNVDVAKTKQAGISPSVVLSTLQGYYGGMYVSNFNRFGKLYRVMMQADPSARISPETLNQVKVRVGNEMSPITNFITLERVYGPDIISRFNLFTSISVSGTPNPGYSNGDAIKAIQEVAAQTLPMGYGYEFSGMTREEQNSSAASTAIVFGLCLLFVYLLLSAQYESYILPLSVILSIPLGLMGSFLFAKIFGVNNNIYLQIGLIMLIGLLAKNAILIVEFALDRRKTGMSIVGAAIAGAAARLRPILMTGFAMIIGLLPLMLANGVGANGNRSLGTGAVGGMLIGMILQVLIVPALFVAFQKIQEKIQPLKWKDTDNAEIDDQIEQYSRN